ncbi:MAG: hypothetical protein IKA51_02645 [Clostridia bacterium]|nr:hypothetical protein [Clostridia bacterium]
MKKTICIILSIVLLLGSLSIFAACGGGGDPGIQPNREEGYYPNIELTLSTLYYALYQDTFEGKRWNLVKNPVCDLIKEELGISFRLATEVNDIGAYLEKLNADIYAGRLADLANLADAYWALPMLKIAEQNGLLTDMTSYVRGTADVKFSDDVYDAWNEAGEEIFYAGTFDGKIKMLPWTQDSRSSTAAWLFIRTDWLENVGKTIPTSIDEMTEVMRAFKNMNDSTYGLVLPTDYLSGASFFNMYGVTPFYWDEDENGELCYGLTETDPMKDAIAQLQDWYSEGLLNSAEDNSFTNIGSLGIAAREVMMSKAGMMFGSTSLNLANETIRRTPDARMTAIPLFAADGYEVEIATASNCFMYYAVGSNCKYPEAVVKVYNLIMELYTDDENAWYHVNSVFQNELGEDVEGWPPMQFSPIRTSAKTDVDGLIETLGKIQERDSEGLSASELVAFDAYWDAKENGFNNKNYWTYELYKENGVYSSYYENLDSTNYVKNKFAVSNTPAMDMHLSDIDASVVLGIASIIMGENPVEYYDVLIDSWYENGGTEITAEVNAWWDSVKDS